MDAKPRTQDLLRDDNPKRIGEVERTPTALTRHDNPFVLARGCALHLHTAAVACDVKEADPFVSDPRPTPGATSLVLPRRAAPEPGEVAMELDRCEANAIVMHFD